LSFPWEGVKALVSIHTQPARGHTFLLRTSLAHNGIINQRQLSLCS
jgi:hypothetical protein